MTVDDMLTLLNVSVFSSCHVLLYPNVGAQCPTVTWERKLRRLGPPPRLPFPPGPALLASHVPLDSNGRQVRQAGQPPDRARHNILARRYRAAGARPSQTQVWILRAGWIPLGRKAQPTGLGLRAGCNDCLTTCSLSSTSPSSSLATSSFTPTSVLSGPRSPGT